MLKRNSVQSTVWNFRNEVKKYQEQAAFLLFIFATMSCSLVEMVELICLALTSPQGRRFLHYNASCWARCWFGAVLLGNPWILIENYHHNSFVDALNVENYFNNGNKAAGCFRKMEYLHFGVKFIVYYFILWKVLEFARIYYI